MRASRIWKRTGRSKCSPADHKAMNNKPVIITLIICILIAAAGLTYRFAASGGTPAADRDVTADLPVTEMGESLQKLFQEKQNITIDCLGDSITWGMYSTPELEEAIDNGEIYTGYDDGGQMFDDFDIYVSSAYQSEPSYPEVLERELNQRLNAAGTNNSVTTVNDGICGDWIMPWTHERMTCDPDVVVFLMSGNNFYLNVPLNGAFEANLDAFRKQGKIVYLANYPLYPDGPLMQYFQSANEVISEMAEKYQLPLIDLYTMVKDRVEDGTYTWNELYSPDRTHLSVKGYEMIGTMAADALWADITR